MKLTTKGRYAVMAMVELSLKGTKTSPIALSKISESLNIKLNYLEQIFFKLKKGNLVHANKGPGGGYFLTKSPSEVTIISIIEAVDRGVNMTSCGNKLLGCIGKEKICMTHDLWDGLSNVIKDYLTSMTLEKVSANYYARLKT